MDSSAHAILDSRSEKEQELYGLYKISNSSLLTQKFSQDKNKIEKNKIK